MQIAKEPLLYHLCVAAGKGQRYLSRWGEGKKGGRYACALTGWITHRLKVPSARLHPNPADVLSCPLSKRLDWLVGNQLLPLLLEGFGDRGSKKKKIL